MTKQTKKEIHKRYYLKHKAQILRYQILYREKNKDRLFKRDQEYHRKNKEHFQEYRRKNRDRISSNKKIYRLKLRYGLTLEEKEKILKRQNYQCPICLKIFDKKEARLSWPVIDHCHKTKEVRGIIHGGCNMAIGILDDNPNLCNNAAKYLGDFNG